MDQHTFHRPGDRDCMAINRHQWMDYDHFHIQVIQAPYASASTVTSQTRIELPSYHADCDSRGSCIMQGGASLGGETPSEAP